MARQVLPIVGAVIGAYFGGPQGAQIGYAIGSLVGNAVDPLIVDGPKIGDVASQTSSEGVYQPIYFGTAQGAGNIIAQGPNIIRRRKQSQGKGGGPVTITESLYKTFAIRIGVSWKGEEGIVGVSRIWENGKLVYDIREESQIVQESAEFSHNFRLYLGTDTQTPDPDLEAIYGIGNTPSYRGRAYVVFPLYDITQWKAIPQYTFEIVTGGSATPAVETIAIKEDPNLAYDGWLSSPDGLDWSGDWNNDPLIQGRTRNLLTTLSRYIAYDVGFTPVTIGFGETEWSESTSPVIGASSQNWGDVAPDGRTVVIPQGLFGGMLKSFDEGVTFNSFAAPQATAYVYLSDRLVSFNGYNGDIQTSINNGGVWEFATNVSAGFDYNAGICRFRSSNRVLIGGRSPLIEGVHLPGTIESADGVTWGAVYHDNMEPEANLIVCGTTGFIPSEGVTTYIAVANNGQIVYRKGELSAWVLSPYTFPVRPYMATFNGRQFELIGSTGGGAGGTGVIATSPDGINWTVRLSSTTVADENWYSIGALFIIPGEISSEPPRLDEVVSAIHEWCGQPDTEYDVTELEDILVRGLILAGPYTGKDSINALQNLWMIDSPEEDKRIVYRLRGKDSITTLTFDDLIDEPEEATREQAIEYPRKVHLDYQSPAVDYAPAKATSSRSSVDARVLGEMNVQVPVVLTPDEAAQRATVLHKVSWADADGEVVFYVPDEYLYLVPGDCIILSLRGTLRRLRITTMEYVAGQIKLTCRGDRQSAYTSDVEGITPPPPTPPPPSIVGPTLLIVGDWPALRDQDDISTFVKYIGMGGTSPAWHGALGEVSTDGGNTYADMLDVSSGSIMGTLQEDITDAAAYFADHTNVVTIQLDIDDNSIEIDSLTESQFLAEGGGFALVNADGSFEIMQYRDAVDLGDGLYELSYLQRGRLDSTTSDHAAGARFVLLESMSVVTAPTLHLGLDIYHRATSYGNTTETATVVHDVFEGNSQREWPVAHLFVELDGDTIEGTIVPRHRFGTEANPIRSINWTGYSIQIQDFTDQIETFIQTSDTFTFDASAMTLPITVSVAQINRLTGDGPTVSEVIV